MKECAVCGNRVPVIYGDKCPQCWEDRDSSEYDHYETVTVGHLKEMLEDFDEDKDVLIYGRGKRGFPVRFVTETAKEVRVESNRWLKSSP